jgi:hypothetical protein
MKNTIRLFHIKSGAFRGIVHYSKSTVYVIIYLHSEQAVRLARLNLELNLARKIDIKSAE